MLYASVGRVEGGGDGWKGRVVGDEENHLMIWGVRVGGGMWFEQHTKREKV